MQEVEPGAQVQESLQGAQLVLDGGLAEVQAASQSCVLTQEPRQSEVTGGVEEGEEVLGRV